MTRKARIYISAVMAGGVFALLLGFWNGTPGSSGFWALPLVAALASLLKVRLPGMLATYSPASLVLLYGVFHGQLLPTLIGACAAAIVPSLVSSIAVMRWIRVGFNVANLCVSVVVCFESTLLLRHFGWYEPAVLTLAACLYFTVNILITSGVVSLTSATPIADAWNEWYVWTAPYYLAGAAIVAMLASSAGPSGSIGWLIPIPLLYLVHFFSLLAKSRIRAGSPECKPALSMKAACYVYSVIGAAVVLLAAGMMLGTTENWMKLAGFAAAAIAASMFKIRLPGMTGTVSLNFVVLIASVAVLSAGESVLMAVVAAVTQTLWRARRARLVHVSFNAACLILSTALSRAGYETIRETISPESALAVLVPLTVAAFILYVSNTVLVAVVLCLTENRPVTEAWQQCNFWAFPYYLVGATGAGLIVGANHSTTWYSSVLILPALAMVFLSYRVHVSRLASGDNAPDSA